jgi:hypothetical protein
VLACTRAAFATRGRRNVCLPLGFRQEEHIVCAMHHLRLLAREEDPCESPVRGASVGGICATESRIARQSRIRVCSADSRSGLEVDARPSGVDDELEGKHLLGSFTQSVQSPAAHLLQGAIMRVAPEAELDKPECHRQVALTR